MNAIQAVPTTNNLTTIAPSLACSLTMTSREIAALTGKRHDHVMADIASMLTQLGGGLPSFRDTYIHPQNGQTYPCFALPKDLTITLVSGYSVQIRHTIVTRWMELEAAQRSSIKAPTNLREALLLALAQDEQIEALKASSLVLTHTIATQAPKVAVYDSVIADQRITVTAFARLLPGVNTRAVMRDLVRYGYLFDTKGGRLVYAQYRGKLFGECIDSHGSRSVYVLAKGKEKLVDLYNHNRLTMRVGHSPVLA
jgi:phage regulator Rha-like protein